MFFLNMTRVIMAFRFDDVQQVCVWGFREY